MLFRKSGAVRQRAQSQWLIYIFRSLPVYPCVITPQITNSTSDFMTSSFLLT